MSRTIAVSTMDAMMRISPPQIVQRSGNTAQMQPCPAMGGAAVSRCSGV
jgi:hypothetical protein